MKAVNRTIQNAHCHRPKAISRKKKIAPKPILIFMGAGPGACKPLSERERYYDPL
jgi:hypothetical protein